jgi:hypothetical protein
MLPIPNLLKLRQELFSFAAPFIGSARLISKIPGSSNIGILQRLTPGAKLPGDALCSGFEI